MVAWEKKNEQELARSLSKAKSQKAKAKMPANTTV
jgi:hypothetical protein